VFCFGHAVSAQRVCAATAPLQGLADVALVGHARTLGVPALSVQQLFGDAQAHDLLLQLELEQLRRLELGEMRSERSCSRNASASSSLLDRGTFLSSSFELLPVHVARANPAVEALTVSGANVKAMTIGRPREVASDGDESLLSARMLVIGSDPRLSLQEPLLLAAFAAVFRQNFCRPEVHARRRFELKQGRGSPLADGRPRPWCARTQSLGLQLFT